MTNEELVLRIQRNEDKQHCLEMLYLQNKGMIAAIAKRYSTFVEFDDLMQEGFFGLCKACECWDSCKGEKFMTYAQYCIVSSISSYVSNNKNVVRIPEHQNQMIQKYNRLVDEHIKKTSKEPSDRYLILHLGITAQQLSQLKKDVQALKISSLQSPVNSEDESMTLESMIKDPVDVFDQVNDRIQNEQLAKELWDIVDSLEPEQSEVIRERYQKNRTQDGTAKILQKTPGNVANIESKAMRELRRPRNKKRLEPYHMKNSLIYSVSLGYSSLGYFTRSWTSAPEKAVLMAEEKKKRN